MTTTIHADGPLYVGPPYANQSFDELFTVLVVGVFVLVVAAVWCMAWRERRWWASYSAAQSRAGGEGQR